MAELFECSVDARPYAEDMLASMYARGAPASSRVSYIAPVDIQALPVRNFASSLSGAQAVAAIDVLAHGSGDEAWWEAAKSSEDCGGLLLPLPRDTNGMLLLVFRRFEHCLRIWGPAERIELPI